MLDVPTLAQMLTVIGLALFATIVLVTLLGLALARVRSNPDRAATAPRIPAQRRSGSRTPVASR